MTEIVPAQTQNFLSIGVAEEISQMASPSDAKAAAEKVESMFASMLIKSLRQTTGEEGLFPGDKSDALGSLFDSYMGTEISKGRGLGVSQAISAYAESADQEGQS